MTDIPKVLRYLGPSKVWYRLQKRRSASTKSVFGGSLESIYMPHLVNETGFQNPRILDSWCSSASGPCKVFN